MTDATEHHAAIRLGFDQAGDEHLLFASRNLWHSVNTQCGCNPDAANTENPYGDPPTAGVWEWYHRPFEDEL